MLSIFIYSILPTPPFTGKNKNSRIKKKQRTHPVKCWFSRTSSPHHSLKCKSLSFIKLHQLYSPKVWNYHKSQTTKTPAIRSPQKNPCFETSGSLPTPRNDPISVRWQNFGIPCVPVSAPRRRLHGLRWDNHFLGYFLWLQILKIGLTSMLCK